MYINIVSIPSEKYVNRGLFCARIFAFEKKKNNTADVFTRIFITFFFCRRRRRRRLVPHQKYVEKITLNDNVQTIIVVRFVLNVESVWGAVATEIL